MIREPQRRSFIYDSAFTFSILHQRNFAVGVVFKVLDSAVPVEQAPTDPLHEPTSAVGACARRLDLLRKRTRPGIQRRRCIRLFCRVLNSYGTLAPASTSSKFSPSEATDLAGDEARPAPAERRPSGAFSALKLPKEARVSRLRRRGGAESLPPLLRSACRLISPLGLSGLPGGGRCCAGRGLPEGAPTSRLTTMGWAAARSGLKRGSVAGGARRRNSASVELATRRRLRRGSWESGEKAPCSLSHRAMCSRS
mmetsp:Transcript_23649/g.73591  ORF Transcript_23649/g.73591 Transcript_23649/m.73591 type:complete len:253 (+) Transcript_23649:31-789(+)